MKIFRDRKVIDILILLAVASIALLLYFFSSLALSFPLVINSQNKQEELVVEEHNVEKNGQVVSNENKRDRWGSYTDNKRNIVFLYPLKWGDVAFDGKGIKIDPTNIILPEISFTGNQSTGIDINDPPWWISNISFSNDAIEDDVNKIDMAIKIQEPEFLQNNKIGETCKNLLKNRYAMEGAKELCVITSLGGKKVIERYLYANSIAQTNTSLVKTYTFFHYGKRYDISMKIEESPDEYNGEFWSLSEKIYNRTAPASILARVDEFDKFAESITFIE